MTTQFGDQLLFNSSPPEDRIPIAHLHGRCVAITIKNTGKTWPKNVRIGVFQPGREPVVVARSPRINRRGQGQLICVIPKGGVALQLIDQQGGAYGGRDLIITNVRPVTILERGIRVAWNSPRKLLAVLRLLRSNNHKGRSFRFARAVDELNSLPYRRWLELHQQHLDAHRLAKEAPNFAVVVTIEGGTAPSRRTVVSLERQSWRSWTLIDRQKLGHYRSTLDQQILWLNLPSGAVLAPQALAHLVEPFVSPEVGVVYSDEDVLDRCGRRHSPFLKPAWSPILASSGWLPLDGALVRLATVPHEVPLQKASVNSVALAIAASSDVLVIHLPRVLLSREKAPPRRFNMEKPKILSPSPVKVTVVIPTRDRQDLLHACINGLKNRTVDAELEIIIVDNDSREPETLTFLRDLARDGIARTIPMPGPFNFARACNIAAQVARHDLILLLNNDVDPITPDWLVQMVQELCDPSVGAVGAYLLYPDGLVQHAGVTVGAGLVARHTFSFVDPLSGEDKGLLFQRRDVSAVTAACLLTRKSLWLAAGGMDEENLTVAFNDVDYCLKLRGLNKRVIWTPYAKLWHHESVSRGRDDSQERFQRFANEEATMYRRWGKYLRDDPFHNPNFSKVAEDFVLENLPQTLAGRSSLLGRNVET